MQDQVADYTLRLRCRDGERLAEAGFYVLSVWRDYTDASAFIYARTENAPHNTVTPVARFRDGMFELDLILRNNITTKEHPLGVFHPHADKQHIKKENIGLIEAMGLAVLPPRLKESMELIRGRCCAGTCFKERAARGAPGMDRRFCGKISGDQRGKPSERSWQTEIGLVFEAVWMGVFKDTAAHAGHRKVARPGGIAFFGAPDSGVLNGAKAPPY